MSTEETLRKALTDLQHPGLEPCWCAVLERDAHDDACMAARAALAIPPTVERLEYRAAWDLHLRRTGHLIDPKWDLFNNLIDARLMLGQVADESSRSSLVEARNLRVEERAAAGEWKAKL